MSRVSILSIGPAELIGAVFSTPLVSLAIALVVAGLSLAMSKAGCAGNAVAGHADTATRSRYASEHRTLGATAIAVVILFVVESVVRGYILNTADSVSWWRFAFPLFCAALGLIVLLVRVVIRGTTPPEVRVANTRRTWITFGPQIGIIAACVALVALLTTTVLAGLASSPDDRGRYIWLVIPVPNEAAIDPIRQWFYGWAYGAPVLICLALLGAAAWTVLHCNASRPYRRPETVIDEKSARRDIAAGTVQVALAGMLIALAGAWRFIARSGTGSQLFINGQNGGEPYDMTWRYAELAAAGGWIAPILEVIAFALLIVLAVRAFRRPKVDSSGTQDELTTSDASVL
ncbi:hypothetical protein GCM10010213_26540 [Microbacterium maritypicum]|uniref:Uncharacterized protein n=1 Tax=Microbacterium maritypicum TaxID=33918 RepID=A0A4Y4BD47_MICMQ|nr:hypothetical protein MLI01_31590 [Microbacterium liquefaciens]GGV62237.1 hypothetical protein GCM10010213_26540 [Microbacterium liquefaciens]